MRIGAPRQPRRNYSMRRNVTQPSSLADVGKDTDLVIDATADHSVQQVSPTRRAATTSSACVLRHLPGVRPGVVALPRPDADVCWRYHVASTIAPLPAHESSAASRRSDVPTPPTPGPRSTSPPRGAVMTTLDAVSPKKKPEPSAEELTARELVRVAEEGCP